MTRAPDDRHTARHASLTWNVCWRRSCCSRLNGLRGIEASITAYCVRICHRPRHGECEIGGARATVAVSRWTHPWCPVRHTCGPWTSVTSRGRACYRSTITGSCGGSTRRARQSCSYARAGHCCICRRWRACCICRSTGRPGGKHSAVIPSARKTVIKPGGHIGPSGYGLCWNRT